VRFCPNFRSLIYSYFDFGCFNQFLSFCRHFNLQLKMSCWVASYNFIHIFNGQNNGRVFYLKIKLPLIVFNNLSASNDTNNSLLPTNQNQHWSIRMSLGFQPIFPFDKLLTKNILLLVTSKQNKTIEINLTTDNLNIFSTTFVVLNFHSM